MLIVCGDEERMSGSFKIFALIHLKRRGTSREGGKEDRKGERETGKVGKRHKDLPTGLFSKWVALARAGPG